MKIGDFIGIMFNLGFEKICFLVGIKVFKLGYVLEFL